MIFWLLIIVAGAILYAKNWNKRQAQKRRKTDFSKVRKERLEEGVKKHLLEDSN